MLERVTFKFDPLINEMLDHIPEDIWKSPTTTFLDPAFGGGQFLLQIKNKLQKYGHSDENIASRIWGWEYTNISRQNYARSLGVLGTLLGKKDVAQGDLFSYNWNNMKFDVVVGNPPYQDGDQDGGQNKIYNQFSKRALELGHHVLFITPVSVTKPSKRFTIAGLYGLKIVDFTVDKFFEGIGTKVCMWYVDKSHSDLITIKTYKGVKLQKPLDLIYDFSELNDDTIRIINTLKTICKNPENRMFKQNPVDASQGRSAIPTIECIWPVYKIHDKEISLVQYNKPKPKLHDKNKLVVSLTKSFEEDKCCCISSLDFDVNHVFVDVENEEEISNIKSFLFSDWFKEFTEVFKKFDGYGFNNAVKYLPTFDKTKRWTENDVRDFMQGLVSN